MALAMVIHFPDTRPENIFARKKEYFFLKVDNCVLAFILKKEIICFFLSSGRSKTFVLYS